MELENSSSIGSPNINLRKNFERGHIYRGIYIIQDFLKEQLQNYQPIPHLKVRTSLYQNVTKGAKDLTRISKLDDEECQMFVDSMQENYGIINLIDAESFISNIHLIDQFGATVIYLSNKSIEQLKLYLKAYSKLYEWSTHKSYSTNTYQSSYYPLENYLQIKSLLANIQLWQKVT